MSQILLVVDARQLGGNGKIHSSALAKVDYPADNPINLESWIEIYERDCAPRFALENES